jgi:hypothetical protein
MPIGSAIPADKASNYQLRIRLSARLETSKIITKLKLRHRPMQPAAPLPDVKAVAITTAGVVAFSPTPPDDSGQIVLTIPPTDTIEIQITLTQPSSYRQRYQLNRAIVQLSDGKITNLLSDAEIG